MGYNIDRNFSLNIPEAIFPKVTEMARKMYEEGVLNGDFQDTGQKLPLTPDDMLAQVMESMYGEGGSIYVERAEEGSTDWQVVGNSWGKSGDWEDNFTDRLAKLGVTGIIDCMGEDSQLWRDRLKDGEVVTHGGEIYYPTDDDEMGLTARMDRIAAKTEESK